jgi:hypothetical protein
VCDFIDVLAVLDLGVDDPKTVFEERREIPAT